MSKIINKESFGRISQIRALNEDLQYFYNLADDRKQLLRLTSHDLKNSIKVVEGFSKVLDSDVQKLSINQILDIVKDISYSVNSVYKIIFDTEQIVNLDTKIEEPDLEIINVEELIDALIIKNLPRAKDKEIILDFQVINPDFVITTDYKKLELILQNLLSNAITFSDFKKIIKIRAYEVNHPSNLLKYAYFEIEDQGPGLSPEELAIIFNPYIKKSNRPTNNEVTSGLGLAFVKKAVELLEGKAICRSVLGEGSVFGFYIPSSFKLSEIEQELNQQFLLQI